MLAEIPKGAPTFVFQRTNGKEVTYNLETLVDYFLTTGDFTEPETRLPFTDADLAQVDAVAAKAKLGKGSVLEAKKDPDGRFAEAHFRRDALNGLERCAGELVTEMVACIEGDSLETAHGGGGGGGHVGGHGDGSEHNGGGGAVDGEEGQMRLVMYLFPLFCDLFRQLHEADAEFATMCMRHFMAYVEGPPNRPTRDRFGLLGIVVTFFHQVSANPTHEYGG